MSSKTKRMLFEEPGLQVLRDTYSIQINKQVRKKDGTVKWKVEGWYPTLAQAFEAVLNKKLTSTPHSLEEFIQEMRAFRSYVEEHTRSAQTLFETILKEDRESRKK